jgi:ParB-like chromosome segregation protein Spo0J
MLMKSVPIPVGEIYVPARLRQTLDPQRVQRLAEDIIEHGQKTPIQVRRDTDRYVLVTGLHRLEAMRYLGERTIDALIVQARKF